jgi:hypothetical protein
MKTSNYRRIEIHNSQNARRRGVGGGYVLNRKTGQVEFKHHVSVTMERSAAGQPAAVMHSPAVLRSMRSKYVPHIGKKHAAKLNRRVIQITQ